MKNEIFIVFEQQNERLLIYAIAMKNLRNKKIIRRKKKQRTMMIKIKLPKQTNAIFIK